jgi:hypothetical protein
MVARPGRTPTVEVAWQAAGAGTPRVVSVEVGTGAAALRWRGVRAAACERLQLRAAEDNYALVSLRDHGDTDTDTATVLPLDEPADAAAHPHVVLRPADGRVAPCLGRSVSHRLTGKVGVCGHTHDRPRRGNASKRAVRDLRTCCVRAPRRDGQRVRQGLRRGSVWGGACRRLQRKEGGAAGASPGNTSLAAPAPPTAAPAAAAAAGAVVTDTYATEDAFTDANDEARRPITIQVRHKEREGETCACVPMPV